MSDISPLPPRLRDSKALEDLQRQTKTNLKQLGAGFLSGRFLPARRLGSTSVLGDSDDDESSETLAFRNIDRGTATSDGTFSMKLTYLPEDGSEHVFWHPNGGGGIHIPASDWTRVDQILTVPTFPGLGVGDGFTCEYAYLLNQEDPVPSVPFVVGTSSASAGYPSYFGSVPLPAGTLPGDYAIVSVRGFVAPGGGDIALGATSATPGITQQYGLIAPPVAETVFAGAITASMTSIDINIIPNPSYTGGAYIIVMILRGIDGVSSVGSSNTGISNLTTPTPQVSGQAAAAITWAGNQSFGLFGNATPAGYTYEIGTGFNYSNTTISWWYDPDAAQSPSGNYFGEGCCILGLTIGSEFE